jgi:diaminopimelate epimerase
MARFNLVKAHAFGNDFLLMSASGIAGVTDVAAFARAACDRHRGIGADGLMLVDETSEGAETRLWNADGSKAEVSGNGVRSAAAWVAERRGLQPGSTLTIGTAAGPRRLTLLSREALQWTFRAEMGAPTDLREENIEVDGLPVPCVTLRVGNPQCVVLGHATEERLRSIASALSVHARFPEGTNVELADVIAPHHVRILIWERGVGPTQASGTGACAAAVAAAFAGGAARDVMVESPGGTQHVEWTPETIWLTGWAEVVADVSFRMAD